MTDYIKLFEHLNLGGISDSKYQGAANSVAELVNLDVHSEGGVAKVNQKLTAVSTITIDDLAKAKVECSDGAAYFFGETNGKIWRRDTSGVYTLQNTIIAGVISAKEFDGYIYYATQNNIGRVLLPNSGYINWAIRNDTWATFTNQDSMHPMKILNLVLFIGDGNLIAQVEGGVFSANALDIQKPHRIKSLGNYGTDLLFGTYIGDNVHTAEIGRWSTWSVSYKTSDPVPESSINAFLDIDNAVVVSAGEYGNLYTYNGTQLVPYKRIRGDYSETKCTIHNESISNFKGIGIFGLSQISGNGVKYGIYSIGRYASNYPVVLSTEYIGSHGSETDVEYGAIIDVADGFLVSWKQGVNYGVDYFNTSVKATSGYIVAKRILLDRSNITTYGTVEVAYESLPENTSIKIYKAINGGSDEEMTVKIDTVRNTVVTEHDVNDGSFVDIKVELVSYGNNSPVIQEVKLNIK